MLIVPDELIAKIDSLHELFERNSGIDRHQTTIDTLDERKAIQQAELLKRFTPLEGKRVLEVGSGLGMNLVMWSKTQGVDMTGVEPSGQDFNSSADIGRALAAANGVDPARIVDGVGEALPFPDKSFDVVYSTNVLEHTNDPVKVLEEAVRVLRPGGVMQFVFPNYHSYFDGHYGVFHPPCLTRSFFPWYVKTIWRRDPAFAHTLRTECNAFWTRKQVKNLSKKYDLELLGMGDDVFMDRMTSVDFGAYASLVRVKRLLDAVGNRTVRRFLARLMISMGAFTPVIVTVRRRS